MPSVLTHTQHLPLASLCFTSLPKLFIFGLPLQSMRMPQTLIKASLVHVRVRHKCSSWFCCVALSIFLIFFRSPSEIMLWYSRSKMMASASTSVMKRCRKSSRTCSAAYVEREELWQTKLPTSRVGQPSLHLAYKINHQPVPIIDQYSILNHPRRCTIICWRLWNHKQSEGLLHVDRRLPLDSSKC